VCTVASHSRATALSDPDGARPASATHVRDPLALVLRLDGLAGVAGVAAGAHQLARVVGLLAREAQSGVRGRPQAQGLAPALML